MSGSGDCCDGDGIEPGIITGLVIVPLSSFLRVVVGNLKELLQLFLLYAVLPGLFL